MPDSYSASWAATLAAGFVGKDFFNIPAPVQHTNDFGSIICDAIENDMRPRCNRSEPWAYLIPRAPSQRMVLKQAAHLFDVADDSVSRLRPRGLGVIAPNLS